MKKETTKDYYGILGARFTATADEIRDAYLSRMRVIHPDRFDPVTQRKEWLQANEMLAELNEAYATLRDAEERRAYDEIRVRRTNVHAATPPPPPKATPSSSPPPPPIPTKAPPNVTPNETACDVNGPSDEELRAFVGSNSDYYLGRWNEFKIDGSCKRVTSALRSVNWAAFFLTAAWMTYRKMYKYAFGILAVIITINILATLFLPDTKAGISWLIYMCVCGIYANHLYRRHVEAHIAKIKQATPQDSWPTKMSAKGGVSFFGPIILGPLLFALSFLDGLERLREQFDAQSKPVTASDTSQSVVPDVRQLSSGTWPESKRQSKLVDPFGELTDEDRKREARQKKPWDDLPDADKSQQRPPPIPDGFEDSEIAEKKTDAALARGATFTGLPILRWEDHTQHYVDGRLAEANTTWVVLERADGYRYKVRLADLLKSNQDYIRQMVYVLVVPKEK